jgi:NAD(P)-dependent dehydrogenase (short-subunit alcohol dehydrogenase family)
VAIVTGGGAPDDGIGNGRAAAILLARAGARVLVVDILREAAEQTVAMIEEEGGSAAAFVADVADEGQCRALVDAAVGQFGRLDLLDNNVGIGGRGSVVDTAVEDWRRIMQINVDSMFLVSRHAIPAMIETAGGGAIVNVSSISALRPRGLTAYSTSKGAVIALTRAMAVDHGPQGIRVNCVAPGPIYTPRMYTGQMTPAGREARRMASVLGIEGVGWDIGYAVRFLLSQEARYITGQTLVVDGGASLVGPARAPG